MLLSIASTLMLALSPTERLSNACIAEGTPKSECVCYAAFLKKHATDRELKALATLAEPENHKSMETAVNALLAAGLTPGEIFTIGVKVEELAGTAEAACKKTPTKG